MTDYDEKEDSSSCSGSPVTHSLTNARSQNRGLERIHTVITTPDTCISFQDKSKPITLSRAASIRDRNVDLEMQTAGTSEDRLTLDKNEIGTTTLTAENSLENDANLVDWRGIEDPKKPQNWKRWRKWRAIALVSAFTFMSPISSSILAPSLNKIGEDLHIKSDSVKSLCLSIFVLGFAFGPLILAPLSELYGRSIILQTSNLVYLVFNLACGFAKTKEQLIIFRLFAGLGGSAPLALGSGVLSDLFIPDERGLAVGIYSLFPLLGPALGPICGGFITEYSDWRWAFWATSIFDLPILLLALWFLEETYPPTLLLRQKHELAKATGNLNLYTKYEVPGKLIDRMKDALIRPMKLLGTQAIIIVLSIYTAYLYGLMYMVLTTFPKLWSKQYGQSVSIGGLNYISLGLGYGVGIQISSFAQDRIYRSLKTKNGGIGLPEFRAPLMIPVAILIPIGLFIYGWTAQYHTHWIFPNIGAALFAAGIMIGFNALMSYVVDSYPTYAASAVAATSLLRCLAAFLFPLFAPIMYSALGYGWGNSVLAFFAISIGIPAPILFWYYGARLRANSTYCSD